jgi:hypothetical protein
MTEQDFEALMDRLIEETLLEEEKQRLGGYESDTGWYELKERMREEFAGRL